MSYDSAQTTFASSRGAEKKGDLNCHKSTDMQLLNSVVSRKLTSKTETFKRYAAHTTT